MHRRYHFSSLLGVGPEIDIKLLIGAHEVLDDGKRPSNGDAGWRAVLDSFDLLPGGFEDGQPIIQLEGEQWKAVVLFGKADGEQLTVGWGLQSYNAGDAVCWSCPANRSDMPFTNLQEDAEWRQVVLTNAAFMSRIAQPHHPLVDAPFLSSSCALGRHALPR